MQHILKIDGATHSYNRWGIPFFARYLRFAMTNLKCIKNHFFRIPFEKITLGPLKPSDSANGIFLGPNNGSILVFPTAPQLGAFFAQLLTEV